MASLPTSKEAAQYILHLFVHKFGCRPSHVLRINNFLLPFSTSPWHTSDLDAGLNFAAEQGWIEILRDGISFRLTEAGYEAEGDQKVDLNSHCNELVTLEKQDGSLIENINSLVTDDMVLIPNKNLPIEAGDAILRKLPSGLVSRLTVTNPGFYGAIGDTDAHYQTRYRVDGQKPEGSPGYVINNYGQNSRTNIHSTDNSHNTIQYISQNLTVLGDELTRLREALVPHAKDASDYAAIGAVANAENAAKSGDSSKVHQALSHLGTGTKWVLGVAKDIGVSVAVEAIKKYTGIS